MEFRYGMRLRGFSPGCQPMKGFICREDDTTGKYWDVLVYDRELTESEIRDYELDRVELDPIKTLAIRIDKFMSGFDPYEYMDREMDVEEAEKLLRESPETVINYLLEILEDFC